MEHMNQRGEEASPGQKNSEGSMRLPALTGPQRSPLAPSVRAPPEASFRSTQSGKECGAGALSGAET